MAASIVRLRASSLAELADCPARWAAKNILKRDMKRSAVSHIGTSIHTSTAVFDRSYITKGGLTPDEAAGAFVDALRDKNVDVDWKDDDISIDRAEEIGLLLHKNYCNTITPVQDYTDVEVECEALDVEFKEYNLILRLTGSTDRVRATPQGFGISDIKTGKTAVKTDGTVDTAKHGAQLGVYELLVENATGKPITAPAQIVGMQTNSKGRVGTAELSTAKSILLGTREEKGILDHAAAILKHGIFWGNPRSMMCHEKYCPAFKTCKWRF